jgi:DeoR/GlpR family transcriptional regulator of sugar metabolism
LKDDRKTTDTLPERHRRILEILARERYATVGHLHVKLNVSESTIRNDFSQLETEGLIARTHGGARLPESNDQFSTFITGSYLERCKLMGAEKDRIARAAAKLVVPRSVIGIDGGTTTFELARHLADTDITVVTNGIYSALELSKHRRAHVILMGGELNLDLGCITGRLAEAILNPPKLTKMPSMDPPTGIGIKVDQLFTSPAGLTLDGGLMDTDLGENYIKKLFISVANRVIVLADHTKINHSGLISYAPLSVVHTLITDDQADPEYIRRLEEQNIRVIMTT